MLEVAKQKEDEVIAEIENFSELPDAPPVRRVRLTWVGKLSVAMVVFWLVIIVFGPSLAPFHEMDMDGDDSFLDAHTNEYGTFHLGTDYIGRDTLSRIMFGARNTIGIALFATLLAYLIGVTLGVLAAIKGGWIDMGISRVNDALLALPNIMLGLLAIAVFGSSIPVLIPTVAVIYASGVFRIARAFGQDIMVQEYVLVAQTRGEGIWWILKSEILPNAAVPLATDFGLRLVFVVLFISSLSFLGLGIQPPMSSWGLLISHGVETMEEYPWLLIYPALSLSVTLFSLNFLGDGLRDALDPRSESN